MPRISRATMVNHHTSQLIDGTLRDTMLELELHPKLLVPKYKTSVYRYVNGLVTYMCMHMMYIH